MVLKTKLIKKVTLKIEKKIEYFLCRVSGPEGIDGQVAPVGSREVLEVHLTGGASG